MLLRHTCVVLSWRRNLEVILLLTSLRQLVFPSLGWFWTFNPCVPPHCLPLTHTHTQTHYLHVSHTHTHTHTHTRASRSAVFTFPSTPGGVWFPEKEVRSVKTVEGDQQLQLKYFVLKSLLTLSCCFIIFFLYLCTLPVITTCLCEFVGVFCAHVSRLKSMKFLFYSLLSDSAASLSAPPAALMVVSMEAVYGWCCFINRLNILITYMSPLCNGE